jgi:hypothetical protein
MLKKVLYLILFIVILNACKSPVKDLRNELLNIVGKDVVIPKGLVPINFPDSINPYKFIENHNYKIVVYIDSLSCSECRLKKMFPWNEYFYLFYEKGVPVYIIMNTPNIQELEYMINNLDIEFPIFIDIDGKYKKANIISNNEIFRTVLARKTKVVLAGDPTTNNKILKLYVKEISRN